MLESKQRQITDAEKLPIPTVQAIIDGKLTGALSGKTLDVVLAGRRQDDCRHTGLRDGRHRPRCRRRAARLRSAPLAGHEPETAQAHPARLGRSRRRRSLAARRAREPRHGHADPARRRARDQLRDRQSAVVRRGGRQALRRACASRRQRHRHDLAHAARRGRRDTALECAGHDRRLEARPGPRCRKFGGAQAG